MKISISRNILLTSGSFRQALIKLLELKREKYPKFSNNLLAERIGCKSKGTISDVLNGRRFFSEDKVEKLAEVFQLEKRESDYFKLLWNIEKETNPEKRQRFVDDITKLSKLLGQPVIVLSERIRENTFALEVYSAFSLFKDEPTLRELLDFFGRERILDLEKSLRILIGDKIITRKGDQFFLCDSEKRLIVTDPNNDQNHAPYEAIKSAFLQATKSVEHWYNKPKEALVGASILSCKAEDYEKKLREFAKIMYDSHFDLESKEADMLVRFNVMVYPIGTKKS